MKFTCPKCGFSQRVRTSHSHVRPFPVICRNCNTPYLINWKIRVSGKDCSIICSWCAAEQADASLCKNCGRHFSGYSPVRWEKPKERPLPSKTVPGSVVARSVKMPRSFKVAALCLLLLSVVTVLIGASLRRQSLERQYLPNCVIAIYGIKSGMDLCERTYGTIIAEGRKEDGSVGLADQQVSWEEKQDLATVKGEVDRLMRTLENPPEKHARLSTQLDSMYRNYAELNELANAPLGPLEVLEARVRQAKERFTGSIADLKSNMPPQLAEEVKRRANKYKLGFLD